jgi:predicted nucleotidyltransferase
MQMRVESDSIGCERSVDKMHFESHAMLRTRSGHIFTIAGNQRNTDQVRANLVYIPLQSIGKQSTYDAFRKVADLSESHPELCPQYYRICDLTGGFASYIPAGDIAQIFSPRDALRLALADHACPFRDFIQAFSASSSIALKDIGLFGSRLIGIHRQDSDWDFVVYGRVNLARYLKCFAFLPRRCGLQPMSVDDMEHITKRYSLAYGISPPICRRILKRRRTKFTFDGNEIAFHFAPYMGEEVCVSHGGRCEADVTVRGRLLDDVEAFYNPRLYPLETDTERITVLTYRFFFREAARVGEEVEVFGTRFGTNCITVFKQGHFVAGIS